MITKSPIYKLVEFGPKDAIVEFIERFKLAEQHHAELDLTLLTPADDGSWTLTLAGTVTDPASGTKLGTYTAFLYDVKGFSNVLTESVTVPEYVDDKITGRNLRMVDINLYAEDPDSHVETQVARLRRIIVL